MKRKITLGLVSAMEMLTKVLRLISSEVVVVVFVIVYANRNTVQLAKITSVSN